MKPFILASASPRRHALLQSLGLEPEEIIAPDIDEAPRRHELPKAYVLRIAEEKARKGASMRPGHRILAADTVVATGRSLLPKAEDEATARACLHRLSGRRHRTLTAVALMDRQGSLHLRCVETRIAFKRITPDEMAHYLTSGEWQGKAGGYAIQGLAAAFIPWISGSHSAVVGLPLAETFQLLQHH